MTERYAVGIDFGTTKSHLAFISRATEDNVSPRFATYLEQSRLVPTRDDTPFFQGAQYEPVPTLIAIDRTSEDLDRPRLVSGFGAINPHQPNIPNYELISDLKERASQSNIEKRNVVMENRVYPVEGLIAHFLWSLRKNSKELHEHPIDTEGVTITVPAKSGIVQRMTMQFSAAVAGFKGKIDIVEEPVAAFLYHAHLRPDYFKTPRGKPRYALIVDFGGGTCDVAVVQFLDGQLPCVIGRAMGRFGGGTIDKLFLRRFWIKPKGDRIPISWSEFESADAVTRLLLLAHARKTKELLAQLESEAADISGSIPFASGQIIAPRVSRADLKRMLEEVRFSVRYADNPESQDNNNNSVRGHLISLIDMALKDAKIERSQVAKLILAGGSVKLRGVRDWVLDFLRSGQGRGGPNEQLQEADIYDQDPDLCVAGGAAIHQLYRHHNKREWHGAVTPTLSSRFWLVSWRGSTAPDKCEEIELGAQHDKLPIDCTSYWKAKIIYPVRRSSDGEIAIEIGQGENTIVSDWRYRHILPKEFGAHGFWAWLKAILVRYYIDEFGILQKISLTPGSLFTGWQGSKRLEKYMILKEEQELEIGLQSLRLDNLSRIEKLHRQFIPRGR